MTETYKKEINEILVTLGENLDISESQHKAAINSYEAVGDWLSKEGSSLYPYSPRIIPQGSFMLGTITKPINDEDDIDIDLVCKLEGKPAHWTQKHLKEAVGDRLKEHSTYKNMLEDEDGGRRCWTLEYSDEANYHMDVLPSISDKNFKVLLSESFNNSQNLDTNKLAIRITDNEVPLYSIITDTEWWMKSNPFGYAQWFFQRALYNSTKMITLSDSVDPVRPFQKDKLPLQRVIQLLKRHRDIMFSSDEYDSENRPISIIITTLASRAYDRGENIVDAYVNIVNKMRSYIETKHNPKTGQYERWVSNPVNAEENFADKWADESQKEEYFYAWLDKLEEDLSTIKYSQNIGLHRLSNSFSAQYGEKVVNKTFAVYGEKNKKLREMGQRKMAIETGILGTIGKSVPNHNFEGSN